MTTLLYRFFLVFFVLIGLNAQVAAFPGLPADFDPDPQISTPAQFLGFDPAEHHLRHDQIIAYLEYLAETSDRVSIEQIGRSHGLRPLKLLVFSSPERQAQLAELRADRVRASRAGDGPPVIWLGYAVHGNEASGVTAAMITAWYLASARNNEVSDWLDQAVILMEPVLNPDGVDRFAHWVNMHRGVHPVSDPADREHHENWPNGRTNYYWFDLNRDWLPLVHPESRARLAQYHAWRPHVVTDHHEMGPNRTYFFQPGVPERNNPLTPSRNFALTAEIAEYHARRLDAAGEPYYTRENYDDYYAGKGSTYPDLTGSVGILFEQGSVRGHVQDTDYGRRTFAQAVANQVRTSLSTIEGAVAKADELIAYQAEFFRSARRDADRDRHEGWIFGDAGDPARGRALVQLLLRHRITVHPVTETVTVSGQQQPVGSAWAVPSNQDQYRLLRSVFEPVTELTMETFYDVSTWPLGLSFDLPLAAVRRLPSRGEALESLEAYRPVLPPSEAVAWIVPWNQRGAAPLLAALLAEDYRVQVFTKPTRIAVSDGTAPEFVRGSLVVHRGLQPEDAPAVGKRLAVLAEQHAAVVHATDRGLAVAGADLGSPSAPVIDPVRPAMVVGPGLTANHAGYIWHWFDHYLQQPLTRLDWQRLGRIRLSDYTHLILPDGNYSAWSEADAQRLADFVSAGGILLAARRAAAWAESLPLEWDLIGSEEIEDETEVETSPERRAYGDFEDDRARELIGGSVLGVTMDPSHPLAFGYTREGLAVMRRGRQMLQPASNPYSSVAVYTDEVLVSGFLSEDNRERLAGTPALSVTRHGAGTVVRMADDYLFRGYWSGTERLFANALFFSSIVGTTRLPSDEAQSTRTPGD
ncbi:MAG: M14 family zinc carboxypeptidase [Wenzhouxiangella sp.]|nr:M14 family zinc carboxypeptidase [Wenzhouxiangella sp.]